jgi:hypothetical protein
MADTNPTATPPATADRRGPKPVGKVRSAAAVVIFSIITLGIYYLVWIYKVFRELNDYTGDGLGGVIALVIALLLDPVIWFVLPSEIGNVYAGSGREKPVRGVTGLWNLIPLLGFIIWVVKVQGAMNRIWEAAA